MMEKHGKIEIECKYFDYDCDFENGANNLNSYYTLTHNGTRFAEIIVHDTFQEAYINNEIILEKIVEAIIECKNENFIDKIETGDTHEISEYLRKNPEELINYFDDFCKIFRPEYYAENFGLKNIDELKEMIRNISFIELDNIGFYRNYNCEFELNSIDGFLYHLENEVPENVLDEISENVENLENSKYVKFDIDEYMELEKMIIEW